MKIFSIWADHYKFLLVHVQREQILKGMDVFLKKIIIDLFDSCVQCSVNYFYIIRKKNAKIDLWVLKNYKKHNLSWLAGTIVRSSRLC